MKETEWADAVTQKLSSKLRKNDPSLKVEAGRRLIYANEIREYQVGEQIYHEMAYQTDILIYEEYDLGVWKPRVVIETKVDSVSTHDSITYSQKSATHKYVHPYLRYGIFLGNRNTLPLPGRLFRHGAHFDFMISWKGYNGTKTEWSALTEILLSEVESSRKLEEMIFDSRIRSRNHYFVLHKPLVLKNLKK